MEAVEAGGIARIGVMIVGDVGAFGDDGGLNVQPGGMIVPVPFCDAAHDNKGKYSNDDEDNQNAEQIKAAITAIIYIIYIPLRSSCLILS